MKLHDLSIKQFIEKTASNEAMPAGGSTLALCAALAESAAYYQGIENFSINQVLEAKLLE